MNEGRTDRSTPVQQSCGVCGFERPSMTFRLTVMFRLIILNLVLAFVDACGPGHIGIRTFPDSQLDVVNRLPDVPEESTFASGNFIEALPPDSSDLKIIKNREIIFRDNALDAENRRTIEPCRLALNRLSTVVLSQWRRNYRLYVIDGYNSRKKPVHGRNSLHYEGRAFDVKLVLPDRNKPEIRTPRSIRLQLRRLAGLAYYGAGFSFVQMEANHVHLSCSRKAHPEFKRSRCFPADGFVRNMTGHRVKMKDVRIGDHLMTLDQNGNLVPSEVVHLIHEDSDVIVHDYIQIKTSTGQTLILSSTHLIFTFPQRSQMNRTEVFARDVQLGDYIHTHEKTSNKSELTRVESIRSVTRRGAYAPLTRTGTMLVNDAFVSCYSGVTSHRIGQLVYALHRYFYPIWRWLF